ncbi:phage tail protein [Pantoea dispersa]|uniref:glycine-rich domain-containing protein n=1 Tax=Pantoea dispersa TaxID=59814 RepID=UPI000F682F3B|nr:phage tail protein [Pantoea dispersa]RRW77601.1 phage tail protein [Pantoea dispersa]
MDRQIVYPGAIPLETDLLNTNKYAMIGLAKLASALLGSNTYVHGLACTASSPASMVVNVAAGQIYSLQNIDGTAYSSLAADTTHTILKQGLILDATQFTLTAPGTSGYSVNYLIQVAYTDTDSGATVLPYYNASNPSVAWSGPNNSGTAQNTIRSGVCTVSLKAGVAATTGTQATPSPDSGYTGLYVITVAQGATTVTSANISVYPNAPILNQAGIYDSFQRNTAIYGVDSGAANAYVVNINPKILSLTDGAEVIFKATNANTGSSTLNVCALGAFPVISKAGATLIANEIVANSLVKVRWVANSSSWALLDATGTFQTAPTAVAGTATTQVATTAFVNVQLYGRLLGAPKLFTTAGSGTYTPTTGTKAIYVECIGGGGGGGGCSATASGSLAVAAGGGSGGYVAAYITNPTATAYTVGAAGAAGIGTTSGAGGGLDGGAGGNTTFGSSILAGGGGGGTGNGITTVTSGTFTLKVGAAGGTAGGGDINSPGNAAPMAVTNTTGNSISGFGAPSILGGSVRSGFGGTSAVGASATSPGAGGAGAYSTSSPSTFYNGGAGAPGMIRIWEFA